MGYGTVKNYIVRIMNSLGFTESQGKFEFDQESDLNFDKTFIVTRPQGEIADGNTLGTTFYPTDTFRVEVAWQLSENAIYEYDFINADIDDIKKALHSPNNFKTDSIKNFQYKTHTLRKQNKYLLAEFNFEAVDSFTHA